MELPETVSFYPLAPNIVNRGKWFGSPANFKWTDKGDNMEVE
jgi:hypothetical protein